MIIRLSQFKCNWTLTCQLELSLAIIEQLQNKFLDQLGPYPPLPLWEIGLSCIQIIQEVHRPNFNCNCACKILKVYLSGWCHCLSGWCHCLSGGWCHCLSGPCHCLSGGSHSDNEASLSSSKTVLELPTGTELGKNYIQNKFLD